MHTVCISKVSAGLRWKKKNFCIQEWLVLKFSLQFPNNVIKAGKENWGNDHHRDKWILTIANKEMC